ncbi:MAG: phosphoribosylanthranilate isomerase [Chthoniobacterales bacterium]|nr:phosphoribosylanthranilate isomerase [Chthoniobacterales bacterium]
MFGRETATGRLRVKICGITNSDDAHVAVECGADAIGLNCFPRSKRYLDIRRAGDWLRGFRAAVIKVAIVVDAEWQEAVEIAALPYVDALQLHGSESPEFCARLAAAGIRFGKALPATAEGPIANPAAFSTGTIVLDSASHGAFGGTGKTFPWHIARRFVDEHRKARVILAGGLTPENVADAVREVRPFGVDVTTGIESAPGRKDHARVKRFIDSARAA